MKFICLNTCATFLGLSMAALSGMAMLGLVMLAKDRFKTPKQVPVRRR